MKLTIAYCTVRKDPRLEWFLDSLERQIVPEDDINLIVVSLHKLPHFLMEKIPVTVVQPKPNVWQGPWRLTKEDWFAAANARNTALCLAPDGFIVYADDLSVLMPGWLDRVRVAMQANNVVCGTYRKVKDLVVENGEVKSFTEYPGGMDSRWRFASSDLHPCEGGWLFGCSCAMPVEALLTIGGWTEFADGLSSEDYLTGLTLQNAGYKFVYDRLMMTYESEELHHVEPSLKRTDKGKSPDDKSHRALNIVLSGQRYFDNYYEGGMRALRSKVLAGEPFPVIQNPRHDWFDSQPISEM